MEDRNNSISIVSRYRGFSTEIYTLMVCCVSRCHQVRAVVPVAAAHTLAHLGAVVSIGAGAVGFVQVRIVLPSRAAAGQMGRGCYVDSMTFTVVVLSFVSCLLFVLMRVPLGRPSP